MELYNRAYKLDPEIDRHIDHDQLASEISQRDLSELEPYYNPFKKLAMQNNPVDRDLLASIIKSKADSEISTDTKATANSGRVISLSFKDDKVNLLKDLPSDVLDKILGYLGWMHLPSLETVSTASRDLFMACRQESLWKYLHEKCTGTKNIVPVFDDDSWRMNFIMGPHFRTDGLYISKITYLRQGYQESAISQPSHLVTYYRYLRFFNTPEIKGRLVVALVTIEKPKNVIDKLREIDLVTLKNIKERIFTPFNVTKQIRSRSTRNRENDLQQQSHPNLFIGTFKLETGRKYKLLLFDAHSKHPMRLKMVMEMDDPSVKGIPSYRTGKCLEYCGRVENGDGEKIEFDTNNWGKFYFSPVKSYK